MGRDFLGFGFFSFGGVCWCGRLAGFGGVGAGRGSGFGDGSGAAGAGAG